MTGYDLDDVQDREDRRKHLELVSKVVDRMAGASAAAKGWSVTIASAAFGVAVVRGSWFIFLLGVGALVGFGLLDGQYLHTEKKFRDLYAAVTRNEVEPLSMDTTCLSSRRKRDSQRSWSVLGFYGPLALAGLLLMVVAICRNEPRQGQPPNPGTSTPTQNAVTSKWPTPAAPTTPNTRNSPSTTPVPTHTTASSSVPGSPPGQNGR